jgi:UDP-N-acetylmuramyl pentapeptide phosphotransferase/UDP-N-acetylglucosamine-1-phosphate transferase
MTWLAGLAWLPVAFVLSWSSVRIARLYAHRRGMLDQPGRRRSHTIPTPRGGGVGIVLAVAICLPATMLGLPHAWPAGLVLSVTGGLLLVAITGWWDDHHALPVWPRLAAQLVAVLAFSLALVQAGASPWWVFPLLVAGAWSINLHNFMDGIDGLLAQQAVFVSAGLAFIAWRAGQPALAMAAACVAAASAGFWAHNRPPASIFMGDVGSGGLGFLIFALSAMLWWVHQQAVWSVLILSSAFIADASLTLLSRIGGGRRWHAPHREHLYQWLARSGSTHARVDGLYMAWNVLMVAPCAWWVCSHPELALPVTIGLYVTAIMGWIALKRRCLRYIQSKDRHVVA